MFILLSCNVGTCIICDKYQTTLIRDTVEMMRATHDHDRINNNRVPVGGTKSRVITPRVFRMRF